MARTLGPSFRSRVGYLAASCARSDGHPAVAAGRSPRLPAVIVALLLLALLPPLTPAHPGAAQIAPVSREVLALYDSTEAPAGTLLLPTRTNLIHALAEMPLNFL